MGKTQTDSTKTQTDSVKPPEEDASNESEQGSEQTAKDDSSESVRADRDRLKVSNLKLQADYDAAAAKAKLWDEHQAKLAEEGDDDGESEGKNDSQSQDDSLTRENALLKVALEHHLDKDNVEEISELLEGVPSDQFADRAERLAKRLSTTVTTRRPAPDLTAGKETPPGAGGKSGDFLRDAFRRNH